MILILFFNIFLIQKLKATEICTTILCDDSIQKCAVGMYCKLNGFIGECCVNSASPTVSPTSSPINPLDYLSSTLSPIFFQTTHSYSTQDYTTHRQIINSYTTPHSVGITHRCEDRVHPQTKISDCPIKSYLCNDKLYYNFMTYQCPKTCGRCNSVHPPLTHQSKNCQDKTNHVTGRSDCSMKKFLCNNEEYKAIMELQCPKTCKLC